jgi:type I site-specific restriction endonuclease
MSSTTDVGGETAELIRDLQRAATRLDEAETRVEEVGAERLDAVADAVESFEDLLASYEERATGTGDFRAFVEFQEKIANRVEAIDGDLPGADAFDDAEEHLDQRRLKEVHFERAREALEPARQYAERLDERAAARRSYRQARRAVADHRRDVDDEIDHLERLQRLGEADLDAPTDRLREPIAAYDDAVADAFEQFKRERPAREVLGLVERTGAYPLVAFRDPPTDLLAYVREHDAGREPIPELVEYAGYSRSKLQHYVDDADALKRAVATQQTYLERLDAEPLTVGWPPPAAGALRAAAGEYEAVVHRFAGEDVVAALRTVRRLPVTEDYARLRDAAVAEAELEEEERRLVEAGEVADRLAEHRRRREALADALDEHPER